MLRRWGSGGILPFSFGYRPSFSVTGGREAPEALCQGTESASENSGVCVLTHRSSGRGMDKVPLAIPGVRAAQLNVRTHKSLRVEQSFIARTWPFVSAALDHRGSHKHDSPDQRVGSAVRPSLRDKSQVRESSRYRVVDVAVLPAKSPDCAVKVSGVAPLACQRHPAPQLRQAPFDPVSRMGAKRQRECAKVLNQLRRTQACAF